MLQAIYGGGRPAELARDLVRREAQHVTKDDDAALLVWKRLEGIPQHCADVRIGSNLRGPPPHQVVRRDRPTVTKVIESGVPRDPQEPGREGCSAFVVALHAGEKLDEDIVRDVLGVVGLMHDALNVTLHIAREVDVAVLRCSTIALARPRNRPPCHVIVAFTPGALPGGRLPASSD